MSASGLYYCDFGFFAIGAGLYFCSLVQKKLRLLRCTEKASAIVLLVFFLPLLISFENLWFFLLNNLYMVMTNSTVGLWTPRGASIFLNFPIDNLPLIAKTRYFTPFSPLIDDIFQKYSLWYSLAQLVSAGLGSFEFCARMGQAQRNWAGLG